jgi:hypothetical protein
MLWVVSQSWTMVAAFTRALSQWNNHSQDTIYGLLVFSCFMKLLRILMMHMVLMGALLGMMRM